MKIGLENSSQAGSLSFFHSALASSQWCSTELSFHVNVLILLFIKPRERTTRQRVHIPLNALVCSV